ncbi:MAG: hypothetical protein JWN40_3434 [Phycisphaerales bacterium]|nr:hypothetical protein [Phycisphaerales bacterium]
MNPRTTQVEEPMHERVINCRVCGSERVVRLGAPRYRPPTKVAGVPIRVDDLDLSLYRCSECDYQFVAPVIPQERLLACYRESSGSNWKTDPQVDAAIVNQRYYANKRAVLERFSPGRQVLDFGCYDGGFLKYLGAEWQTAGIEPSTVAAGIAAGHGVQILGPTIDAVGAEHNASFDAIISFDVLEHLPEPVATLSALRRLLRPGGVMVVETGNSAALAWRLTGPAYPYCGIVEHVGFFNERSLGVAGRRAGLELAHFQRSCHTRTPLWYYILSYPRAAVYLALRALRRLRVPLPEHLDVIAQGGFPATFGDQDHFIAVLRRPQ